MRFAIIVGCVLAGTLGTSCGDIHVVPADGGAGKSGGDGGPGGAGSGGAAGNAAGTAGAGSAGAAGSGPTGAGGGGRGGGAAGNAAGTAGAAGTGSTGAAGSGPTGAGGGGRGGGGAAGNAAGTAGTGAAGAAGSGPTGAGGGGRGGSGAAGNAAGAAGTGATGAGGGGRGGGGAAGNAAGAAGTGATGAGGGGRGGGAAGNVAGAAGAGAAGAGGGGGGAGCRRELLTNGEFDLAASSWSEAPLGTRLVRRFDDAEVASHQVTPQSGLYVLRLGAPSNNYVVHYVEQYANIPSGAQEITISGYVQIRTDEEPDDIYDEAYVQLFDESTPSSPFFRSAPRWSNLTQASNWTPFSFPVNVASVAGKEMVFRIIADLDTGVPTYFYFDTLSVAVTRCSP